MVNYDEEISAFKNAFCKFKKKRIAIYGIGRYTSVLLPYISDFNIVGLLDRKAENIGVRILGCEVISLEEAEKKADLIIINTHESNWDVIYNRIKNVSIPVYFRDGSLAKSRESGSYLENLYWNKTIVNLRKIIERYEVITFDVFDTIVSRKCNLPEDVFDILSDSVKDFWEIDNFAVLRKEAQIATHCSNQNIGDIYKYISQKLKLDDAIACEILSLEIEIEKSILAPRKEIINLVNDISKYKDVWFISDMYFNKKTMQEILLDAGVIKTEKILLSCECNASKADGTLWDYYIDGIQDGRSTIHIGDNVISDEQIPRNKGINTYSLFGENNLFVNSSLGEIAKMLSTKTHFELMGLLKNNIFGNPFSLANSHGLVVLDSFEQLGYVLYGPTLLVYCAWLSNLIEEIHIERIFFMARDGFLLKKCFDEYCEKTNISIKTEYFAISRRLVLVSSYAGDGDLSELIGFPYQGLFGEFIEDRFGIIIPKEDLNYYNNINIPGDNDLVNEWLSSYKEKIIINLEREKKNYLKYISRFNVSEDDLIVDLWYRGNNQYYLSKTLNKPLKGAYFVANLNKKNVCLTNNQFFVCFQDSENDLLGDESWIYKKAIFVESFLTAPYGMIRAIDENGKFIHDKDNMNQKLFDRRYEILNGALAYITDYLKIYKRIGCINEAKTFVNELWHQFYSGNIQLSSDVKEIFYYDNTIVKRDDIKMFD